MPSEPAEWEPDAEDIVEARVHVKDSKEVFWMYRMTYRLLEIKMKNRVFVPVHSEDSMADVTFVLLRDIYKIDVWVQDDE